MGRSTSIEGNIKLGLWSFKAFTALLIWYITSFLTLFMNKYTLSTLNAEAYLFSTIQIVVSTLMGLCNMYYPCGMGRVTRECIKMTPKFYAGMLMVGLTRFLVVFLSLLSLEFVAVSFTETVKSSAPLFTVIISRLLLGEQNGLRVMLSLLPIVFGLVLCSAYEVSFNMIGFLAALGTNIAECLQFVLSKKSMSGIGSGGDSLKSSPAEFQFYSSLASIIVQMPICLIMMDYDLASKTTPFIFLWMIFNGLMYHYQTLTAWVLMEYISPVTHSVCNTVKRAIAIWLSLMVYGNRINWLGLIGTVSVVSGVFIYNRAREMEGKFANFIVNIKQKKNSPLMHHQIKPSMNNSHREINVSLNSLNNYNFEAAGEENSDRNKNNNITNQHGHSKLFFKCFDGKEVDV